MPGPHAHLSTNYCGQKERMGLGLAICASTLRLEDQEIQMEKDSEGW